MAKKRPSATLVVFGASGDLMGREVAPAIHSLMMRGLLPPSTEVIGVAKDSLDDDSFRSGLSERISKAGWLTPKLRRSWSKSAPHFSYLRGDLHGQEVYRKLSKMLSERHGGTKETNCIFHLAVPPQVFPSIIRNLKSSGLAREAAGWRRVVIEKPFGHDLRSSRALERDVRRTLDEAQVYRVDHFLGKESVQNVRVLRFENATFEPLWKSRFVDSVQVMMDETLGVEGRGEYYECAGVMRDMVQNHLFQLVSLVAMEAPLTPGAEGLRRAKTNVLRSMRPISPKDVVLGQYRGYRREKSVSSTSTTPTFGALRVWIDTPRWRGVPFYLRTGKRMARKATEILVRYKVREETGLETGSNYLRIRVQPEESIRLGFNVKAPGPGDKTASAEMAFDFDKIKGVAPMEAYERLLYDVLRGDRSLFVNSEFEELAWSRLDRVIRLASSSTLPVLPYEPGSWGPAEADTLLSADGHSWATGP